MHALAVGCGPADPTLVGTQKGLGPGGEADPGVPQKGLAQGRRGEEEEEEPQPRPRAEHAMPGHTEEPTACLALGTHATHSCDCSCHLRG